MVPFVIVADLRTGSTLLSSSLDRHPEARCYGELLHPQDLPDNLIPNYSRYALRGAELIRQALAVEGFKAAGFRAMIFLPLPSQPQWVDAWQCLKKLPGLRVIYLTRRDRVAQYASVMVAEQTGAYHPYSDDPILKPENRPRIKIDPAALQSWINERDHLLQQRKQQLQDKPSLEVEYENLVTDWTETMRRVQEFLEVEPIELSQAKQKQETRPIAEIVVNHEELAH